MSQSLINILAAGLYLIVGGLLLQPLRHGRVLTGGAKLGIFALGLGAVLLHTAILYTGLRAGPGMTFALTNAASLLAWAMALLFLLAALYKPVDNLGIVIMPVTGVVILIAWLWPSRPVMLPAATTWEFVHIIVSMLAYGLLSLAAIQSLLLLAQERQLRHKHPGGFIRALPPLQTMEHLMFQLIGLGFALLTLTVISGAFFSEQLFGRPLRFTHHIVLSIFAWFVFGILLFGRWRFGWRGRPAVRWTLGGCALLVLAYLGSKFVFEVILGR
jgi:ABC-type uncharacterized transport system permease subunit